MEVGAIILYGWLKNEIDEENEIGSGITKQGPARVPSTWGARLIVWRRSDSQMS